MRYLLHDVFLKTVKAKPENIAIVMENGTSINYWELNSLSNKFARLFLNLKKDIRQAPYVGIISPVHIESIASIIGALKVGCAYVPLDEYSPMERLEKIIDNTKLDIIVVDSHWYEQHSKLFEKDEIRNIIILDKENKLTEMPIKSLTFSDVLKQMDSESPVLNQVSDDLAYILHSSGSTGIPKGIMLTHRNARTFVDWMQKEFQVTENDVVMSRAPFKFDLSVFDIFNTFNAGAKLVCYDWSKKREESKRHSGYVELMARERATIFYTTPSTFISLMNRGSLAEAKLSLRKIMYAGEPFPTPQIRKLKEVLPNTRIANIYGPTETNIITYYWVDKIPDNNSPIPLGNVVEDTEILVVSEDGKRICKPNEIGELWCRGGTVTLGYLGMGEQTRRHLVLSPFHPYPVKFWKTGDFGYRDENECLYYRGRKDHMVKVRGYRIEIGEVELAISSFPGIDEFAVVAIPDEKYGNRLYCYYSVINVNDITEQALLDFLKIKIPEYMIPYRFIVMDVLPKTSSGKVDRVWLAEQARNTQL